MTTIDLSEFDGLYTTDRHGNVKNRFGKMLGNNLRGQYATVRLTKKGGISQLVYAHRLVYHQQIGAIPAGLTINHKDGNPRNNRIENLELMTVTENNVDATIRRSLKGGKNLKMTQSYRLAASESYDNGKTLQEIADDFEVTVKTIRAVLAGEVWGFDGNKSYQKKMEHVKKRGDNNRKLDDSQRDRAIELTNEGKSGSEVGKILGVHRSTIGRIVRNNTRSNQRDAKTY